MNALAQYAKQETPVFNAGDAAGQNCQDLKWLKAINEKIDANQYYVYERHDNGVVYNYKTDKVWKQVDNPLKKWLSERCYYNGIFSDCEVTQLFYKKISGQIEKVWNNSG